MATGGLRFWKDGRDAPDVLLALFDYPEGFNLSLRVNFVDGGDESEGFLFTGSEGIIEIAGQSVTITRVPREKEPGYIVGTFTTEIQQKTIQQYREKYPATAPTGAANNAIEKFSAPKGYSDSYDHFANFFASVRSRKQPVEDATFGFRAAGAALLSNLSLEKGAVIKWNPETIKFA